MKVQIIKTKKRSPEKTVQVFWSRCRKSDCWIWTGSLKGKYGWFFFNKRNERAHRVSWMITYGVIPDGLCVLHKCDTPLCVNPRHLFLGTKSDNNLDKCSKGRQAKGEGVWRSKLSSDDARYIRNNYKKHSRVTGSVALARQFGMSHQGILSVVNRETWNHVV